MSQIKACRRYATTHFDFDIDSDFDLIVRVAYLRHAIVGESLHPHQLAVASLPNQLIRAY